MFFKAYNDEAAAPFNYAELVDSVEIGPRVTGFSIDSLETLLNILPDRIDFSIAIRAGRDYFTDNTTWDTWSVAATDSVQGLLDIISPLSLIINEETPLRPVPTPMDAAFDGGGIKRIRLVTDVSNTVPAGGTLFLMAGSFPDEAAARLNLIRSNYAQYGVMTPLNVEGADANPDGDHIAKRDTVITEIPSDALEIFNQEDVWVRQVLVLNPTRDADGDTTAVTMKPEDALTVTVIAEVTYQVQDSTETGE
jgi:hypothetical protein